jgi:putative spermidine/putrescine transport system substrate-binding protein
MKTKIGQVAALGLLMITTAALAQSKPVAGEVAEGSL